MPTAVGVLGMMRMIGRAQPASSCTCASVIPAHMLTSSGRRRASIGRRGVSTSRSICGLTARKMQSQFVAMPMLSEYVMPRSAASPLALPERSDTAMSFVLPLSRAAIAPPMLPQPRKPYFICVHLTCPLPRTTYLYVHSSRSPIGPRACSFCVEMPISQPRPNSPPSVKRVEALT